MTLDTLICDLEEAWEIGDYSKYDLDNIDIELNKHIDKISNEDLRTQIKEYFWNQITSG